MAFLGKGVTMAKSESLEIIAKLIGRDEAGARAYCKSVHEWCGCVALPSFAAIATALTRADLDSTTTREIAKSASQIHQGVGVSVEPNNIISPRVLEHQRERETHFPRPHILIDEEAKIEAVAETEAYPSIPVISIDEAILPAAAAFIEIISCHVISTIFVQSIEGKVIGFTGHGPYLQNDLEKIATKLKAITHSKIAGDSPEWVVIGSQDFDQNYLQKVATNPDVLCLMQEEFLGVLLCEELPILPSVADSLERTHK